MRGRMPHDVLISYSSKDKVKADAICNRLESQGIRCWIAPRDVPVGSEYADSIVQAIESSKVVVLLYSKNADESLQVKREVERAVSQGIPLMPVRIEDTEMSKAFEYYVGSIHWLDAITPPFEAHIDKLAGGLKALLGREKAAPVPPVDVGPVVSPTPPMPAPPPAPAPTPPPPSSTPVWQRPAALVPAGLLVVAAVVFAISQPDPRPEPGPAPLVMNVSSQDESRARDSLEGQGFVVTIAFEESDLPSGLAIRTEPAAGSPVDAGDTVTLFVSGMVTVPQLVGLTEERARAALENLRLASRGFPEDRIVVRYEPGGEEGQVLRSSPGAGERVLFGNAVTLVVSGPQAAVPDVVGTAGAEAVAAVEAADLQVVLVQDWEAGRAPGEVLRIEPGAGTPLDRQSEVTLHVVGTGGWAYLNQPGLQVGQELDMRTSLTIREAARSGAGALGVIRQGTPIRVLAQPTGDGWVKIVQRGGG